MMSEQDAYKDGREQGWRDKERECEKLRAEIERLHAEVKRLEAIVKTLGGSV